MTLVLVSQRVEVLRESNERRDALDQRLSVFLAQCGFLAAPVPNRPERAADYFQKLAVHGVVLSGGNDLSVLGGNAPERDATERALLHEAEKRCLPVIGICRGFQFLTHHDGGTIVAVDGHVRTRHELRGIVNRGVNSFHAWGVSRCAEGWQVYAKADDGTIEFAGCPARRRWGIMWHPEREPAFADEDVDLFRRLLGKPVAPANPAA